MSRPEERSSVGSVHDTQILQWNMTSTSEPLRGQSLIGKGIRPIQLVLCLYLLELLMGAAQALQEVSGALQELFMSMLGFLCFLLLFAISLGQLLRRGQML